MDVADLVEEFGCVAAADSQAGRVDLIGRSIDALLHADPLRQVGTYLRTARTTSVRTLAAKAMVAIELLKLRGATAWPIETLGHPLPLYARKVLPLTLKPADLTHAAPPEQVLEPVRAEALPHPVNFSRSP
ncbi:hypothetical protein [Actinomycetospora sp. NBC_00405]|uniref:hypothetical protein n=1 Tax=Actinomycetospora sp. NBC_00405 TaxID=2975952 RepID=UPI002E2285E4